MRTVSDILEKVYGGKAEASAALDRNKSSPWNWEKAGFFPASIALKIALDAKDRGIKIDLKDIPSAETAA